MILKAFALLDMKTGAFATPFFMHHEQQAIRAIVEVAQDLSTTVGKYPSDFALCRIGSFNDQSGVFSAETLENLGTVAGFLPAKSNGPLFEAGPVRAGNPALRPVPVDLNGEVA